MNSRSLKLVYLSLLLFGLLSCTEDTLSMEQNSTEENSSSEDDSPEEGNSGGADSGNSGEGETGGSSGEGTDSACDPQDYVFLESEGYILAEIEKNNYSSPWEIDTMEAGYSGEGYIVWGGQQYLGNPGNGLATFKIVITNPGTYEFVWNSSVTIGSNGTDHNDSWLRFPDADDFFAQNGTSIVYPTGSGKTPNPEGAGADGWFKVYRGGSDLSFKWQALTFDNNGHNIYVTFNSPGEYSMEISARSSGHAIDKFVLFQDSYSLDEVTSGAMADSAIECGN